MDDHESLTYTRVCQTTRFKQATVPTEGSPCVVAPHFSSLDCAPNLFPAPARLIGIRTRTRSIVGRVEIAVTQSEPIQT